MSDNNQNDQEILAAMQEDLVTDGMSHMLASLSALEAEQAAKTFNKGDRVTHKRGGDIEIGTVVALMTITVEVDEKFVTQDMALVWFDDHGHAHSVKVKNLRHYKP